ncbi:MAG: hypothetical protein JXA61_04440 [Bacteroidales bacterium]|nr:hypothetical protein [Bacteroidales bacterium]
MRISVIDLGTNTFNLLIVESGPGAEYKILYSNKLPVKLGRSGIDKKEIRPDAISRGLNVIDRHLSIVSGYQSDRIYAFATSAIRSARNGEQFVSLIRERFNLDVEVISGEREAEIIYYGVRQAVSLDHKPVLIMDIGGGSNEFIIANREEIFWKKSYPLGIARLLEKFKPSDPITIEEIEFISNYLEEKLVSLFDEIRNYSIDTLIGASGAFDTMVAMIRADDPGFKSEQGMFPEMFEIDLSDFENLYQKLINSTMKERKQMKGLESMRLEMIVLSTLLVKFMLQKLKVKHLIQSNFALKEGIIYQLINQGIRASNLNM